MQSGIQKFQSEVYEYYHQNKRDLPWRHTEDPYSIFVSEVMLQQTQVSRVLTKYPLFLSRFPTMRALSESHLSDVLSAWQGMGYSRRVLYLKQAAQRLVNTYNAKVPNDPELLDSLPGIGSATACSICVYAFNRALPFIETNVRRVFIHHFFHDKTGVDDREIMPLVEQSLDYDNPREWYYALMDYGTHLARTIKNPNRKSKHYLVQSRFEGSNRQVRGQILSLSLSTQEGITAKTIYSQLPFSPSQIDTNLERLTKEGFLIFDGERYTIAT